MAMEVHQLNAGSGNDSPSLRRLPVEILLEIIDNLEEELQKRPVMLTLSKQWYQLAWPIFSRKLHLTEASLWKHMDCHCGLRKSMPKMAPFIEQFRFEQRIVGEYDYFSVLGEKNLLEDENSDDDSVPCSKVVTACDLRASERRAQLLTHDVVRAKLTRRLHRLFEFAVRLPRLSHVDIHLRRMPMKPHPTGACWYLSTGLGKLLRLKRLTSLRLSLPHDPKDVIPDDLCKTLATALESGILKHVFLSAHICEKVLSLKGQAPLLIEDLTLVPRPVEEGYGHFLRDCENKAVEWEDYGPMLAALNDFVNHTPNARYIRIAGFRYFHFDALGNDGEQKSEFIFFHVYDEVSGIERMKILEWDFDISTAYDYMAQVVRTDDLHELADDGSLKEVDWDYTGPLQSEEENLDSAYEFSNLQLEKRAMERSMNS